MSIKPYESPHIFFNAITGSLNINKKGIQASTVDFWDSPTMCFMGNHPPKSNDASTQRRFNVVELQRFYKENDLKKVHGKRFFETNEFTEQDWMDFVESMLSYVVAYYRNGGTVAYPTPREIALAFSFLDGPAQMETVVYLMKEINKFGLEKNRKNYRILPLPICVGQHSGRKSKESTSGKENAPVH